MACFESGARSGGTRPGGTPGGEQGTAPSALLAALFWFLCLHASCMHLVMCSCVPCVPPLLACSCSCVHVYHARPHSLLVVVVLSNDLNIVGHQVHRVEAHAKLRGAGAAGGDAWAACSPVPSGRQRRGQPAPWRLGSI